MEPVIRAKLTVSNVVQDIHRETGEKYSERLLLEALYSKDDVENAVWSRFTPSAQLNITITNPNCFDKLKIGDEVYVDFTPVKKV